MRVNHLFICMMLIAAATSTGYSQEMLIAAGGDSTMCGGGAFDGTNFLVTIVGDAQNHNSITAQLVSSTGTLVGSRISLGHTGSSPVAAFDGTKYLVAWTDIFPIFAGGDIYGTGNIYGQFVSTTGSLIGSSFTLVTDVNSRFGGGRGGLTFQDTTFFLTYLKGGHHTDYLYGQRVSKSGALLGSPVQISSSYAREAALAFDGTNFLLAWCKVAYPAVDSDIYGQFVSKSGSPVGSNFLIDGSPSASDDPVSVAFDGSRYCVNFQDQAADSDGRWNLIGRFVSTSGVIGQRFTICDSSRYPTYSVGAFDGTNYLMTWLETTWPVRVKGRFFSQTGVPVASAFTVFDTLGGKYPIGGVGGFMGARFLLSATRYGANYANGDIYFKFLPSSTTGVNRNGQDLVPEGFVLSQNYPNPFNPSTMIRYGLPGSSFVTLTVYNSLGQQIAVLVRGNQGAGYHEARFDGTGLASGVYYYRLQAGTFEQTKSLLLLR